MKVKILIEDYGTTSLTGKIVDCTADGIGVNVKGSVLNKYGASCRPDNDYYFSSTEIDKDYTKKVPVPEAVKKTYKSGDKVTVKFLTNGRFGWDCIIGHTAPAVVCAGGFDVSCKDLMTLGATPSSAIGTRFFTQREAEVVENVPVTVLKREKKMIYSIPTEYQNLKNVGSLVGKEFEFTYLSDGKIQIGACSICGHDKIDSSAIKCGTKYFFKEENFNTPPKFKVGDTVTISKDYENIDANGIPNSSLKPMVGKKFIIETVSSNSPTYKSYFLTKHSLIFNEKLLEKYVEPVPKKIDLRGVEGAIRIIKEADFDSIIDGSFAQAVERIEKLYFEAKQI